MFDQRKTCIPRRWKPQNENQLQVLRKPDKADFEEDPSAQTKHEFILTYGPVDIKSFSLEWMGLE